MELRQKKDFRSIPEFVRWKIGVFEKEEKSYRVLFELMFSDGQTVMAEETDGFRIRKTTYGQCKAQILDKAAALKEQLDVPAGSIVGICMDNSLDWLRIFWSVLICGWRPLLMNMRLQDEVLENLLHEYGVQAVISDGKTFSVPTRMAGQIPEKGSRPCTFGEFGREIIFMSSGTTQNVKLCGYTAENFFYQLGNSADILKKCPQISQHYEGELKLLTLLPFYHVFGFMAVYLWFAFFSCSFVFLKNLNPQTIQNTVRKHKVTHIFAVPMVWEAVCKAAMRGVRKQGDKTWNAFCRGIRLANSGALGSRLTYKSMGKVRSQIFGDSIRFLISGGGYISQEALTFYNGIGYHIANGYGMTEVGITSLDVSPRASVRNMGSIGEPFQYTQYRINEQGQLLIRGPHMASYIYQAGQVQVTDHSAWFNSRDLARHEACGYFLQGRCDDLIVSVSGENLNPQLIEMSLHIPGAEEMCLIAVDNTPVLLLHAKTCYSTRQTRHLMETARQELSRLQLSGEVHRILVTPDALMEKGDIKISRRKLADRYRAGKLTVLEDNTLEHGVQVLLEGAEADVQDIFAQVLQKSREEIAPDAHFFHDLGGTSLDYFMLADMLAEKYAVDIKAVAGKSLCTVREVCDFIKDN